MRVFGGRSFSPPSFRVCRQIIGELGAERLVRVTLAKRQDVAFDLALDPGFPGYRSTPGYRRAAGYLRSLSPWEARWCVHLGGSYLGPALMLKSNGRASLGDWSPIAIKDPPWVRIGTYTLPKYRLRPWGAGRDRDHGRRHRDHGRREIGR